MTLWHNTATICIKLFLLAQTASLLLWNPSRGSFLSIIILFSSLPRKALVWLHPDLLGHVTWSADLSLSSARKPIKACECSKTRLLKAPAQSRSRHYPPRQSRTFQHTSRSAGPHSHADFLPSVHLQTRFRRQFDYPERHLCQLPRAPLRTNIISVVTQAAFTGRKPEQGRKAKSEAISLLL